VTPVETSDQCEVERAANGNTVTGASYNVVHGDFNHGRDGHRKGGDDCMGNCYQSA